MHDVAYLHFKPEGPLPPWVAPRRFNAVVVANFAVSDVWQDQVSDWLVRNGCLYMLAWGVDCSRWDDTVDHATRKFFAPGEIPDSGFVLTTWHENETLESVFWQAQSSPSLDSGTHTQWNSKTPPVSTAPVMS